jgi:hypothetical protein
MAICHPSGEAAAMKTSRGSPATATKKVNSIDRICNISKFSKKQDRYRPVSINKPKMA